MIKNICQILNSLLFRLRKSIISKYINKEEINMAITMIDIVEFSKYSNSKQYEIIQGLSTAFLKVKYSYKKLFKKSYPIPIGDGFILAIEEKHLNGLMRFILSFLKELNKKKKEDVSFHVAFHMGKGIEFIDICEKINLIGSGLNETDRIIECTENEQILISREVYGEIEKNNSLREYLRNYTFDPYKVRVKDEIIEVYNVYNNEIGNRKEPKNVIKDSDPQS